MTAIQGTPHIHIPMTQLADFCRCWKIAELVLFGSVLRDDFGHDSDIDVLVTFVDRKALVDRETLRGELEALFGRKVDLVYRRVIEHDENYLLRQDSA
ncbi:MAG: nucleotidyltransferase domain-containing protein [Anaerolineae bacterium]|nr:nucleotidyltransferase domain-containing protein [Anaerolineae bacterium]